jgi:glycosyltransferase involved in cell wall biosynthesis
MKRPARSDSARAPLVSVVLPTYRRSSLLERAIDSVTRQTWTDWELLVIDDNGKGSPDQVATEAFMQRFADDARIRYLAHDRNRGGGAARNTGIRMVSGTYVAFLDDDDVWLPIKLERQVACFEASVGDVALVYGSFRRFDEHGVRTELADGDAHTWSNLLKRNGIGGTSLVMCRRSALLEIDGFDESLPAKQDIDLYIRLAERYPFAHVTDVLHDKHLHAGDTIGKNMEATARANALFYDKHRHRFEQDKDVHHHRLRSYGHEVLRAGHMVQARAILWKAWRLRPTDVSTLGLALLSNRPVLSAYRAVRRTLGLTPSKQGPRDAPSGGA